MSKKILIVDDSDVLRKILSFNFKKEGYEVYEARDGEEGLQKIKEIKPDAVCLDIMMPKMDGFTVLKKLKEENIKIPILVLTAKGGEEDEKLALSLGAFKVATKPFSPKSIVEIIKQVVE
ncbi:two-component system, chemotaxis family, response regulator CheY [Marinitoga hydrogenitolerans DSM 16785]|uniref:Two-component system, chemotaxis family, response regulator CheY n=1 Tax=Marinitoga hydrogenitolerans (strain DSM 16785 / JCM 12826 / AT1271) TaxID=1122195 RepID=A0A1M4WYL0_MARH1|nr:response regulator [Marinitoga hydrogenitolerans]SHE86308.1 two-component system, chemotaxis family, response regulator CheY [Marinitoga hydrogenitolerans DSM 16785]